MSEFYKESRVKDGHFAHCKLCHDEMRKCYRAIVDGHETTNRLAAKYRKTGKGKLYKQKYRVYYQHTFRSKNAYKLYAQTHPDVIAAHQAVHYAIRSGKLPKPDRLLCSYGKQAKEYHHSNYAKKDWLKVIPKCKMCHELIHHSHSI